MKVLVLATTLVASSFVVNSPPALSGELDFTLLSREQTQAYHACLFEAWIQDYCRVNSRTFSQCVVANGGGRFDLGGRFLKSTEYYCWNAARALPPG
jgi:hypothetical protein